MGEGGRYKEWGRAGGIRSGGGREVYGMGEV